MTTIYEGMYLLDNEAVRQDWTAAKSIITDTLEKHGATVHTARRWDERRLAYPIKKRNRATFLLTYFEIPGENIPAMRREFELNDSVLRSLEMAVNAIPEEEAELAAAEQSAEFSVPTPPDDDAIDEVKEDKEESEDGDKSAAKDKPEAKTEDKAEAKAEDKAEAKAEDEPEAKAEEAPAADVDAKTKQEGAVASEEG